MRSLTAGVALVCLLSPAFGELQSSERQTVVVGPWNISTTYKGDKFDNCTMGRSASGMDIAFVRNQGGLLLTLDSPKWKLERGKAYTVRLSAALLVNELLTNAFKYAFCARESGTIIVRCLREDEDHYRVVVADDGIGLPEDATWPVQGKLGALILQTLRENAQTDFTVESARGKGMRVTITVVHKAPLNRLN